MNVEATITGAGGQIPGADLLQGTAAARRMTDSREAASMLEGLFLRQLFKVMRKTVPESGLMSKGPGKDVFQEMFDGAIADELARAGGIGLADVLSGQLGAEKAAAPRPSPARAAASFREVAAAGAAPGRSETLTREGAARRNLDGIRFEDPRRPEPVTLRDTDGQLDWPVAGASSLVDGRGTIQAGAGAEVIAAGAGKVRAADGSSIQIEHGDGVITRYVGLEKVLAQRGDLVIRGQTIGELGSKGSFAFDASKDGKPLK